MSNPNPESQAHVQGCSWKGLTDIPNNSPSWSQQKGHLKPIPSKFSRPVLLVNQRIQKKFQGLILKQDSHTHLAFDFSDNLPEGGADRGSMHHKQAQSINLRFFSGHAQQQNSNEHRGNTEEHRGTPRNTEEHRGSTPRKHRGTPRNTEETPRNTEEHRGHKSGNNKKAKTRSCTFSDRNGQGVAKTQKTRGI